MRDLVRWFETNPSELIVDATTSDKDGKIWCQRVSTNSYKGIVWEKTVRLDVVEKLDRTSRTELTEIFGEMVFSAGPYDTNGTVVCQWRAFNGKVDDTALAIEATAAFPRNGQNASFLLLRIARGTNDIEVVKVQEVNSSKLKGSPISAPRKLGGIGEVRVLTR
jgi:hypothetical protein